MLHGWRWLHEFNILGRSEDAVGVGLEGEVVSDDCAQLGHIAAPRGRHLVALITSARHRGPHPWAVDDSDGLADGLVRCKAPELIPGVRGTLDDVVLVRDHPARVGELRRHGCWSH